MEYFNRQIIPNPPISWGIILGSISALEENVRAAKNELGIHNAFVGVNFPFEEQVFPAIVVGLSNLKVQNSGLYSAELTTPRTEELMSYGDVSLEIWAREHNHLMTITDFLSKCYLLNYFNQNQMAFPGQNKSWVSMAYTGGILSWSAFQLQNPSHTNESYERFYSTSTNMSFKGEHHSSIDLATISGITIEAIPLNRIV